MDCILKDYEEECVEEGTVPSELTSEVGEWEDQELNQMETHLSDLLYEACPFHPHQFIHCVNPPDRIWPVKVSSRVKNHNFSKLAIFK